MRNKRGQRAKDDRTTVRPCQWDPWRRSCVLGPIKKALRARADRLVNSCRPSWSLRRRLCARTASLGLENQGSFILGKVSRTDWPRTVERDQRSHEASIRRCARLNTSWVPRKTYCFRSGLSSIGAVANTETCLKSPPERRPNVLKSVVLIAKVTCSGNSESLGTYRSLGLPGKSRSELDSNFTSCVGDVLWHTPTCLCVAETKAAQLEERSVLQRCGRVHSPLHQCPARARRHCQGLKSSQWRITKSAS